MNSKLSEIPKYPKDVGIWARENLLKIINFDYEKVSKIGWQQDGINPSILFVFKKYCFKGFID